MKPRWLFLFVLLVVVIAAVTFSWWFPALMTFIGANSNAIQGLADLIQLILWLGAGILLWFGLLRRPKQDQENPKSQQLENEDDTPLSTGERSVQIGGNAQGNVIVTGDGNILGSIESSVDEKSLQDAYLNHVFESTSFLALAGIDRKTASDVEARLNLGAVYTALMTLSTEEREMSGRTKRADSTGLTGMERRPLSALEELDRHPRLVLLGDPGSGKTTFVNFVALCLAGTVLDKEPDIQTLTSPLPAEEDERSGLSRSEEEKPSPQPWQHGALLPLRVVLRDFAARGLPPAGQKTTAKNLWEFIIAELTACALGDYAPYLRKHLLEKGGLLMLDGLDEVPEAEQRRAQIKSAVEDFASAYPRCRILVTSRTYAYQKQDWRLNGFSEAVLAPFSPGQIRQFVERWYDHISMLRGLNPEDARGRAEMLKRAIFASDRLQGLAERPLLLTLMASLHAWRGGTLPEKREELYADTVDLLLDWWESQRVVRDAQGKVTLIQPSLVEWLKVDRQSVRGLLNELAYQAHKAQPDLAGTADVPENDLVSGLLRISQNPEVKPARLVEFLTTRAGLLLPRGMGVYTFPHRTFQEYLAACYLTDHGYPDEIAQLTRTDPNRWREVALLAGAKATRGGAFALWPLVDALCPTSHGKVTPVPDAWGALIAGQAIQENTNLQQLNAANQAKVERVREWQQRLLTGETLPPLERANAGNTLAQLGDPRFDPEHWQLPAEPMLGFVEIPEGKFLMGSDPDNDPDSRGDEQPRHELHLPAFYIARYPVTVAQFRSFVEDSGYQPSDKDSLTGIGNHPVTWVNWNDSLEYCRWLQARLSAVSRQRLADSNLNPTERAFWLGLSSENLHVSLPSEAEWEKAARGTDGRIYPWWDNYVSGNANTAETGLGSTSPVGCFPGGASPYGVLDLSGNVWEWTRSLWGSKWDKPKFKYPYSADDGREDLGASKDTQRVLRGGSFYYLRGNARCASRYRDNPLNRLSFIGFRIVVSPFASGL